MSMPQSSALTTDEVRQLARKRADDLKGFFTHLGVYLIIITGLFCIDLVSGPGWWFFYPGIAWGVGLAIHGLVIGVGRVFDENWTERKSQEWLGEPRPARMPEPSPNMAHREVMGRSSALIDRMRQAARGIPKPEVRQQVLGLCASADLVLSAIDENPDEDMLAHNFFNRYLMPASTIITGYARLANRNVASARPTLEKVEAHDLNLLSAKIDEIYDRLHRGSLIDLEVAREMFRLDVAGWDDSTLGEFEASNRGSREH
jgi:hypothetical protein